MGGWTGDSGGKAEGRGRGGKGGGSKGGPWAQASGGSKGGASKKGVGYSGGWSGEDGGWSGGDKGGFKGANGRQAGKGASAKPTWTGSYYDDPAGWAVVGDGGWGKGAEASWPAAAPAWETGGEAAARPHRPAASQWRFACRLLQRHAPEERIYDATHQLTPGDHVVVQFGWDCTEQHGIFASTSTSGERAGYVIHWNGQKLLNSPLSKFSDGGELFRVTYPHWACQCLQPSGPTGKPQVLGEQRVDAGPDEVVAKAASNAERSSSWSPGWSAETADLEFCLFAKTSATRSMPPWEIQGRRALSGLCAPSIAATASGQRSSPAGRPLGCMLRGNMRPSELLSGVGGGMSFVLSAASGALIPSEMLRAAGGQGRGPANGRSGRWRSAPDEAEHENYSSSHSKPGRGSHISLADSLSHSAGHSMYAGAQEFVPDGSAMGRATDMGAGSMYQ
ncbi:unnamed protein product [Polarella glacialis]|uniref:Uncharacterized protein n=1 Tax=Polarella glacialis TaxID=89957 RepID=A0A813E203_POLGL|nr:unnamed protein product [Polarella glacialis]